MEEAVFRPHGGAEPYPAVIVQVLEDGRANLDVTLPDGSVTRIGGVSEGSGSGMFSRPEPLGGG